MGILYFLILCYLFLGVTTGFEQGSSTGTEGAESMLQFFFNILVYSWATSGQSLATINSHIFSISANSIYGSLAVELAAPGRGGRGNLHGRPPEWILRSG